MKDDVMRTILGDSQILLKKSALMRKYQWTNEKPSANCNICKIQH